MFLFVTVCGSFRSHSVVKVLRQPSLSGDIWSPFRRTQPIYCSAVFTASLMMHFVHGSTASVQQPNSQ